MRKGQIRTTQQPWIAALPAFLLTGLGQIYSEQMAKGPVLLACQIVTSLVTWELSQRLLSIGSVIDAYLISQKLNRGQAVGEREFF